MKIFRPLILATAFAWLVAAGALAAQAATPTAGALRFRFVLENDYSTSAGAFDSRGALVRTLWSNRRYTAGPHEAVWDGRDDDGRPVAADADYEIRVLTHNVIYSWDGVIGSTSPEPTLPTRHDGPWFFNDLVVSGDRAFFTTPEEGAVPAMRYFRLDAPQSWHALPALPMAYGATLGLIATDGERVYWAHDSSPWSHTWGKGGDQAFVMATDRNLSREIVFEAGTPTCVQRIEQRCYRDNEMDSTIRSAIDVVTEVRENPATPILEGARNNVTGMAVQSAGPLLFVAHGQLSPAGIHVLDKRTGRELGRVPLAGVGRLIVGRESDELWAIHDGDGGRVVSRLRIGPAPPFALQVMRTLKGLVAPITLTLTPDGRQIVVADGGASQQLKAFDATTGEPLWQLGQKGGYEWNGPAVSTDKLSFHRYVGESRVEQTVLGFAPDGSFWVGDTGLSRLLKYGADRRYLDQIAFLPVNYNAVVDRNDPTRVFTTYFEYAVDYTKPIDRSWKLIRFFGDDPQVASRSPAAGVGFVDVATLRNGRTYGLMRSRTGVDVVEIPAQGDLERMSLRLQNPVFMNADGDLYSVRSGASERAEFWRRPLTGFDKSGAPEWGHEESSARVTRTVRDPRINPYGNTFERSVAELAPDLHVLFDPANSDVGAFHLAAVQAGESRWLWRSSPATGRFDLAQPDGVFDTSRPWYAGMAVTALADQIVYNYHGEGWHNAGQANQFLHWYRDGLFVGQFGVPVERGIPPVAAGLAGNSLSIQLSQANGAMYLWHNDEHVHAGLPRWKLDGVEWIRELTARGRLNGQIELAHSPESQQLAHSGTSPSALVAQASGRAVRLSWKNRASGARAVEVQRLQPTYVGPRFERIAVLPPGAESFEDTEPLAGEPTVYRVRASFDDGASEYSNHVPWTARSRNVVLESQNFETPPPDLRDNFHAAGVSVAVTADPASSQNHVLHIVARKPAGSPEMWAQVRWKASPQLFGALNASVGRPRGSRPDIYRVQFKLRLLQARLGRDSEVSVLASPGQDLFSTSGRRQGLLDLVVDRRDRAGSQLVPVSFNFAAIPNGAGAEGLRQYLSVAPSEIAIVFPIFLRADGDSIEFLVDDFSVTRLDPDVGGPS